MFLGFLFLALSPLPIPEKGVLVPVSVRLADGVDDGDLSERVAALRRAICENSRHVRLVTDPAAAAVPFEVEEYEVTTLNGGGGGVVHRIRGRYYLDGKWEPFRSFSSGGPPLPRGVGTFVETFIFNVAVIERERRDRFSRRDAQGRPVPRDPAEVARCLDGR